MTGRTVSRALCALSLVSAAALGAVLLLGRDPAFHARLLAWNNGGWPDAALDGTYPAVRSFRALLEISASPALAFPLFLALRRRGRADGTAARCALMAAALLAGFLLRADAWWTKGFWIDSHALQAGLRTHSFREILTGPLGFGQSAPVGFCALEKAVGEISGWNPLALTFPVFLAGLATLALVPIAVARAGAPRFAAPAALLAAVSPQLVYYSAEFKQYGIDAFFAALSLLAALELGSGRRPRALLAAAFVLGPLFSHTQFFILPGLGLALLLAAVRRDGAWRRPSRPDTALLLLCGGVGGAATLLSWAHTVATMPDIMDTFWAAAFPPRESARAFCGWWIEKALLFFRDPFAALPAPAAVFRANWPLFVPVPALMAAGALRRRPEVRAAALAGAGALALLVVASAMRKWPVRVGTDSAIESRHLVFLLPWAFSFLALGLDRFRGRFFPLAAAVVAVALPVGVSRLLTDRIYSWSTPEAVEELSRRYAGGDPVLLGGYHYAVAMACNPGWFADNESRIEVLHTDDPAPFAERLGELARSGEAFWLLWLPRGKEGRIVPALCGEKLGRVRADFCKKTPAGTIQHFPARRPGPEKAPTP